MSQVVRNHQETASPQETCMQNGEATPTTVPGDKVTDAPSGGGFQQGDSLILPKEVHYPHDKEQWSNDSHVITETCAKVPLEESTAFGSNHKEVQSSENCAASTPGVSQQEDIESDMPPSDGIHNSEDVMEPTDETVNPYESISQEDGDNEISPMEVSENDADNRAINPDKCTIQEDVSTEISLSDGAHISEDVPESHSLSPEKGASQKGVEFEKSSDGIHNSEDVMELTDETVNPYESISQEDGDNEISPKEVSENDADNQAINPDKCTIQEDVSTEISLSDGAHISEDVPESQSLSPEKGASSDGVHNSKDVLELTDETVNPDESISQEDGDNEISPMEVSEIDADNQAINSNKCTIQEDVSTGISPSDGAHISEDVPESQSLSPEKGASQKGVEFEKSSDGIRVSVHVGDGQIHSSDKGASENNVVVEKSADGVLVSESLTHDSEKSTLGGDVEVETFSDEIQNSLDDADIQTEDPSTSNLQEEVKNPPSDNTHVPDTTDSQPEESQNEKDSTKSQNNDDGTTKAHDDDEDEDIIVISETPKGVNKKSNLTTVFKCVRCGQICKSRSELNVHLLQVHKLIIVSKQKAVDCIFCTKSLDMSDFYQHLRTEHKVLLVKSKGQTSDGEKSAGEKDTSKKTQAQDKKSSSKGLIDLTAEEEEESSTSSNKPEKRTFVSKDKSTSHSMPSTSKETSGPSTSKETSGLSTSKETSVPSTSKETSVPSTSKETSLSLRRTPRRVTQRKYMEVDTESSSSDDNEHLDAFDDDEDYDPLESEYQRGNKSKSQTPTKGHQMITKSPVQTVKKAITIHVASTTAQSSTTGSTLFSKPVQLATDVTKTVIPAVSGHATGPTISTAAVPANANAVMNQIVKFNGALYSIIQSGDNKYLIPLNVRNVAAPDISKQGITTPGMSTLQLTSPQTMRSAVNTQGLSTPQITTPMAVSQLSFPSVPHLAAGVGNLPQPITANMLSGPQTNILQPGVVQQPVILSSPAVHSLQTFLVALPQKPVPSESNVNRAIVLTGVPASSQSIVTTQSASVPVAQKNPVNGQTQSTGAKISTQAGNATSFSGLNNTIIQISSTKPSASTTTTDSRNITTASLPTKNVTPAAPPTPAAPTPAAIHIAKPRDMKSSDLHKTGGLFALEVCLDTATYLGTEPVPETITTYILQEKETVFVESKKDDDTQDSETEKALSDAEKCKVVIATAISRGHLMPNDLTSISNDVFFECTRCNSCFPQHILLNLHMKQCSQQAPSSIPKIKIHSPASVVDEFYKDPTGGRNFMYMYCRFCRARIVRNQNDPSFLISHLLKHIEPKVELAVLPKKQKGVHNDNSTIDCTTKALEWVDYIVPPFTLDNPPTSAKNGSLSMFTSTKDPALLCLAKMKKKKKKKKKKKHKYRISDSDEDYENLAGTRLSSLRPKNGRYIGTLRPKETTLQQTVSNNGAGSVGNSIDPTGSKPRGGRTMMHSFKHLRSPNKRGSTLTASIPMKSKYRDRERPGESTRRWNNGKTRSQLKGHWRRSCRRFPHLLDPDASTPDNSTPEGSVDYIELSSDEDEIHDKNINEGADEGVGALSDSPVTITEDDISDYVKIIDEAEELQVGHKATISSSPTANDGQRQEDSDLVDYYGNDVNSTLSCEPLIMEPEQVLCYFKKCSGNLMECQFRSCGSKVLKNIRAMLGHIRVHFQILVPMQLLAKCGTQFPRRSIPRPLSLTFTQVQAHFTISDMQEANLHLGEVQQIYTCNWKNCVRSRCYKKNICGHLVKHIFFTLISKEDYQTMAQTMSTYSPTTEETVVKKLKIVAVNKGGEKVTMMVSIPISQTKTPELLTAAIRKCLASDKSIKLPSQVLESIAAKFSSDNSSKSTSAPAKDLPKTLTEKEEPDFLTRSEIDKLWKKFPNLLEKWKMVDVDKVGESKDTTNDLQEGEENSDWTPMISEVRSLTSRESGMNSRKVLQRRSKILAKRWRSVLHKKVPVWSVPSKLQEGELKVVEIRKFKDQLVSGMKRKGECIESVNETPPNKKDKVENEKVCEGDDEDAKSVPEKTVVDQVITTASPMDVKEDSDGANPEKEVEVPKSRMSAANVADDMACERDSAIKNTESDPNPSTSSTDVSPCGDKQEIKANGGEVQKSFEESMPIIAGGKTSMRDSEPTQKKDQADGPFVQDAENEDLKKELQALPFRTKVVLALTPRQISKAFRFMKSHKNKTVKVAGRGFGYGVFRCRMPQCGFFKEVMTADRKIDLVRALATHLQNVHMKNHPHRTIVLQPGSKEDQSQPKKQIMQHLKDLSTYQDFRKFRLKNMYQRRQMHKTRLLQVEGRRVRMKVKYFHRCLSRKCFFGCFNATRHILITHLQSHLRHLQLSGQKTAGSQQMEELRTSLDDSFPQNDLSSSHQSQVEEQMVASPQEGPLPVPPDFTPEASEDSQQLGNDRMHIWHDSTREPTDHYPTRDCLSPMDQEMSRPTDEVLGPTDEVLGPTDEVLGPNDEVLGPTDAAEDEQMDTVDGGRQDDASIDDADMTDVGDSFRGSNDGMGASVASRVTEDDNANKMSENGNLTESLLTSTLSGGDAIGAGHVKQKDSVNFSECLQDQVPVVKDCGDNVAQTLSLQTSSGASDASQETVASSNAFSHSTPASNNMDELLSRPGDSIQMFHDDLQSYFTCYTIEMKGRKGMGLKHFVCPKCDKKDLRGNNLQGHLETHIKKKVLVTSLDNIAINDENGKSPDKTNNPVTEMPDVSKNHDERNHTQTTQRISESLREDNVNPGELDDQLNSKGMEDANTVYFTEDEILDKYFSKDLSVDPDSQIPYRCEYLRCNQCLFRTLTILDTPKHIGIHIKKTVILKK